MVAGVCNDAEDVGLGIGRRVGEVWVVDGLGVAVGKVLGLVDGELDGFTVGLRLGTVVAVAEDFTGEGLSAGNPEKSALPHPTRLKMQIAEATDLNLKFGATANIKASFKAERLKLFSPPVE